MKTGIATVCISGAFGYQAIALRLHQLFSHAQHSEFTVDYATGTSEAVVRCISRRSSGV
jgi:hypothetical protein